MRVLFYEPDHTGHHFAYLARMLPVFFELPVELVLATSERAVRSEEYRKTLGPLSDRLRIEACCTQGKRQVWLNGAQRVRDLSRAVRLIEPNHVYVMYADGMWQIMAAKCLLARSCVSMGVPMEAWCYRGGFAYPGASGLASAVKRLLFAKMIKNGLFAKVHVADELLHQFGQSVSHGDRRGSVDLIPDPIELYPVLSKTEARGRMGLLCEGRIIACTGEISGRKGVDLLLEAFRKHLMRVDDSSDDRLLLAGPHHERIKGMLESEPYRSLIRDGRVLQVDSYLTARQIYDYSAASDLVVAGYPAHSGRSSIILWAAAAGRPSLGTAWGCIGHVIESNKLGAVCNVLDGDAYSAAIGEALKMSWGEQDAERVRRYAQFHSVENFRRIATGLLRERLEMASD